MPLERLPESLQLPLWPPRFVGAFGRRRQFISCPATVFFEVTAPLFVFPESYFWPDFCSRMPKATDVSLFYPRLAASLSKQVSGVIDHHF